MADTTKYERGARKPMPKRTRAENEKSFEQAAKNQPPLAKFGNSDSASPRDVREAPAPNPPGDAITAEPSGTSGEKPRWEGPPENRPRGYLPAKDDPEIDRDAAGENLKDPEKKKLTDAFKKRGR